MESTPDAPNLLDPQPIVEIHVSSSDGKAETFQVHKNFICYYSRYFKGAFEGRFQESQSHKSRIEDVDPTLFGIFVNWLYTQTITEKKEIQFCSGTWAALWLLGDRFLAPLFQDQALEKLDFARVKEGGLSTDLFNEIYNNTCEGSQLRGYIVATYTRPEITNAAEYPQQMLADLFNSRVQRLQTIGSWHNYMTTISTAKLPFRELRTFCKGPPIHENSVPDQNPFLTSHRHKKRRSLWAIGPGPVLLDD